MLNKQIENLVVDVGEILLNQIKQAGNKGESIITYGDVVRQLPYEFNPENLNGPLCHLSELCRKLRLPLISTIVVNQRDMIPGPGYYKAFFPGTKESQRVDVFMEQYNRVKACSDWTPLAEELGIMR